MTLKTLILLFRSLSNDKAEPYFWSNEELAEWFNEAQTEACIRARLLHTDGNGFEPVLVDSGVAHYKPDYRLYEYDNVRFVPDDGSGAVRLKLISTEEMDIACGEWRDGKQGKPVYALQGDTDLVLVPTPDVSGSLTIGGYHIPLSDMAVATMDTDKPEINPIHHRRLIEWVLYRAFSIPDTEVFDPQRSANGLYRFEEYFGIRVDSDLRRATREDRPHTVKPFWI